jgi:Spy/CpxP family protein refolding chaperone
MVLGVTYAFAQRPGYGPGRREMRYHGSWGCWKGNRLTPEQRAKFQELRRKFIGETAQLRGAILTKRLELRSLWADPKADSQAIMNKEKELGDLQNQLRDRIVQNRLEARKLLTPEQIAESEQGWGRGYGFGRSAMMGYGYGPCH